MEQKISKLASLFLICFTLSCFACTNEPAASPSDDVSDTNHVEPVVALEPFTGELSLTHNGLVRHYFLHIPANAVSGAPLVMLMHGYGGFAESTMNYTGMNALADEHGFVVCYPQGTSDSLDSPFFQVGYEFHEDNPVDDLDFIKTLVAHLQQAYSLSSENVFATGMSNGGDMSYLLACEASQVFKAIAPVAGTMMQTVYDSCAPTRPIPIFEIHGTDDDVTYYEGDLENADGWGAFLDIPSVVAFWVELHGLTQNETTELPDLDASDGSQVTFIRHSSPDRPEEVWLYRIEAGGHDWPGVWGNMDIQASQEIWNFFSQYL